MKQKPANINREDIPATTNALQYNRGTMIVAYCIYLVILIL